MRGSPHVHALVWMKDNENQDAPSFWHNEDQTDDLNEEAKKDEKLTEIEAFADSLISTSLDAVCCEEHKNLSKYQEFCNECTILRDKILKYMTHSHTFTCHKRKKVITVSENEGHGRLDGKKKGVKLSNIPVCRFNFP